MFAYSHLTCFPGYPVVIRETVVYLPHLGMDLIFVRTIISRENNHVGQWGSFQYYWTEIVLAKKRSRKTLF